MLRRLLAFLACGVSLVSTPARAQEPPNEPAPPDEPPAASGALPDAPSEPTSDDKPPVAPAADPAVPERSNDEPSSEERPATSEAASEPPAKTAAAEVKPAESPEGWQTFVSGYFRAPMAIGISPRPSPDDMDGPSYTQLSYGPNRTVDANYYSFAYTRLQEQDWVEAFIHAKKKHVEAVVGWMGYWFQSAGFRNNDAAWVPGMAYLTLDTDFEVAGVKPNIAVTGGAWWPKFGYFEKYDTYTLGQIRQLGEQLKLTIPVNDDVTVTLVQGFGTGRDGSSNILAPPPYQATVGLDLIHYEHLQVQYKDYVDIGLHYNTQWTRDPNLTQQTVPGRAYADARKAHFTTFGGEARLSAPYAGRLWVSPSLTSIRNGWALGEAGVEVMHSLSGEGFATNYLAWNSSPANSTGSGSSFNLGFLYENSLSRLLGEPGGGTPEVTLNVFGLLADAKLDLPATSVLTQDHIGQMKYGADVTLQAFDWLAFMLRWDEVNYDLDHSGYVFSAISPRVTFTSHFLSGESIYIQYSRYRYGEHMVLAGKWPWGLPLVAGSDIIQGGPYSGEKPDMDVIRFQATASF
jgi:hypothetical protein